MVNKGKTHHFRDNSNLLDNVPEGKKSEYIRESLKLRANVDDTVYEQEQISINELKDFYYKGINHFDDVIEVFEEDTKLIKNMKHQYQLQLRKVLNKETELKSLIATKKELIETSDIINVRNTTAESIIRNIMYRREDPSVELLNMDFLREKCEFKTKNEFKIYVQEYVDNTFKPDMIFLKWLLKKEDIEYMKLHINKMIK